MTAPLTPSERKQIETNLDRRANEIALFSDSYRKDPGHFGSVELALSREIEWLRGLAEQMRKEAAQYRISRLNHHWSVIDGIGDALRAEMLDAAIDSAITKDTK